MVEVNKSVLHCQWGTGLIRAPCSWPSSSVALGQLHHQGLLGLRTAVSRSGSTVVAINAAKQVGLWAAARTIRAAVPRFCLCRHSLLVVTKLRDNVADASLAVTLTIALQDVFDTVDQLLG